MKTITRCLPVVVLGLFSILAAPQAFGQGEPVDENLQLVFFRAAMS